MTMWMKWDHLPWKFFKDPLQQWKELPTFLLIEYTCFFLVLMSLLHAARNGQKHILVWLASFVAGCANDIFFMALPLVDNFWQAQATVMITPRLPLYICCVYNVFLYFSMVTSWRLGFENKWPEACSTGLLALLIYYPYDLVGAKHLWWTWHTTDPCISNRILGVPIGSSMWILTFAGCFSLLLWLFRGRMQLGIITSLLMSGLTTTPLMMVVMATIQFVTMEIQGVPSLVGLVVCLGVYGAVVLLYGALLLDNRPTFKWLQHRSVVTGDCLLGFTLLVYYSVLLYCGFGFQPDSFQSAGVHQTFGPCNVSQFDITGLIRDQYACVDNLRSDWNLRCQRDIPHNGSNLDHLTEWYTVCGTPHKPSPMWQYTLLSVCSIGVLVYGTVLVVLPTLRRRHRRYTQFGSSKRKYK